MHIVYALYLSILFMIFSAIVVYRQTLRMLFRYAADICHYKHVCVIHKQAYVIHRLA